MLPLDRAFPRWVACNMVRADESDGLTNDPGLLLEVASSLVCMRTSRCP